MKVKKKELKMGLELYVGLRASSHPDICMFMVVKEQPCGSLMGIFGTYRG